jgi:hypothetical protein
MGVYTVGNICIPISCRSHPIFESPLVEQIQFSGSGDGRGTAVDA